MGMTQEAEAPSLSAGRSRNLAVDLLKTIAILDVLVSHVDVPTFAAGAVGSAPWLVSLFWASVSHISVSLFLLCSGALLLNPKRELTVKKLYTKNFPRLLVALLIWAMGYQLFGLLLSGGFTGPALLQACKEVVLFQHEEHLYYLHIMLLVYAFLPITRLIVQHADRRQLEYLLGLWFLLGILYPTLRTFWPFTLLRGIPTQWLMNMTYASIGYTVLGYYLSVYPPRRRTCGLWALVGFSVIYGGCWMQSMQTGTLETHFLEGMSLGACLLSAGVYGLCSQLRISGGWGRVTEFISKASFCVFLVHIFFLKSFAHFGLTAAIGPALVTVPLMALLLLGCGCAVYAVLSRIPVVRSWLV